MYALIVSTVTAPTVAEKYSTANKCCHQYFFLIWISLTKTAKCELETYECSLLLECDIGCKLKLTESS